MVRESGRERKHVIPFEDQLSAAALISSPHQAVVKYAPTPGGRESPQIKRKPIHPETHPKTPAKSAPGRPRIGQAHTRGSFRTTTCGGYRATKRRRLRSLTSDDGIELPSSVKLPYVNGVKLDSEPGFEDEDGDDISLAGLQQQAGPITPRRAAKFGLTQRGNLNTDSDPVIEQWYADPYERIDPDGPGYDIWRHRNLLHSLQNRGFSLIRAQSLAAWLMRCKGRYQDFEESKNPRYWWGGQVKKGKKSRQEKRGTSRTPSLGLEARFIARDNALMGRRMLAEVDHNSQKVSNHTDHDNEEEEEEEEEEPDEDGNSSSLTILKVNTPHRKYSSENMRKSGSLLEAVNADTVLRRLAVPNAAKQTSDPEDAEKEENVDSESEDDEAIRDDTIAKLRRSLKLFNLVYGDDLPDPDLVGYEVTHTSPVTNLPRAIPRQGFRTQGHHPLCQGILEENDVALTNHINEAEPGVIQPALHPREVLTEDSDFGLTLFLPHETCTNAELAVYNEERRIAIGQEKIITRPEALTSKGEEPGKDKDKYKVTTAKVELENSFPFAVTRMEPQEMNISSRDPSANTEEVEHIRKQIVEELKEQVFKWETNGMLEKSQTGAFDPESYPMYEGEAILQRDEYGETIEKTNHDGTTVMDAAGRPVLQEEDDPAWLGHAKKTLHSWRTIKYWREDRERKLAAGGALAEEVFEQDRKDAKKEKIRMQSIVWRENARTRKRAKSLDQAGADEDDEIHLL